MSLKTKGIIFFSLFFISMIIVFVWSTYQNNKESEQWQQERLKTVGVVQFKGKVINLKTYDFSGKKYYMACIDLEYSNVKDLYVLNDVCAVKIKNNIATMSISVYNSDQSPLAYVEVNINNSGKEKFFFKDGTIDESELFLNRNGLSEKDLQSCN